MRINRRSLVMGGLAAGVAPLTPLVHSQTGKGGRKLVIG